MAHLPNYHNQIYKPKVWFKRKLLIEKSGKEEEYWLRSGSNCSMEILDENIKFGINLLNRPTIEREVFQANQFEHYVAGRIIYNPIKFRIIYNPIKFRIVEFFGNNETEFIMNWIQEMHGAMYHNLRKSVKLDYFIDGNLYVSWLLYGFFLSEILYNGIETFDLEANYDYLETLFS